MRSYKNVRVAKYEMKGLESIISIPIEEYRNLIESDSELSWLEDLDESYKQLQLEDGKPNFKHTCVFNYRVSPKDPDFQATFIPITDDILIRIMNDYEGSMEKLKGIAEKLNAKIYK